MIPWSVFISGASCMYGCRFGVGAHPPIVCPRAEVDAGGTGIVGFSCGGAWNVGQFVCGLISLWGYERGMKWDETNGLDTGPLGFLDRIRRWGCG